MAAGEQNPRLEVVLLGDVNVDIALSIPAFPQPGKDALSSHTEVQVGGSVVNSAISLARLGVRAGLICSAGDDLWANQILGWLAAEGIDIAGIQRQPGHITGLNFLVVTEDGERTMISERDANRCMAPELIAAHSAAAGSILHLSGYAFIEHPECDAAWRAVELARVAGIPLSLDTGLDPALRRPDELRRLVKDLEICILGLEEAQVLFGCETPEQALAALLEQGVRLAAVKLGRRGCCLAEAGGASLYLPVFRVDVLDTTGAGDAFSAGLLYAWLHRLSLCAAGTLASALGALATTCHGAGLGMPGWTEVLRFLRTHPQAQAAPFAAGVREIGEARVEKRESRARVLDEGLE